MGALLSNLKNLIKQGVKDKAKGKKTGAACCASGCGFGCLSLIVLIVVIVMGIVGALQSVYDTVTLFWHAITQGIYMDFVADDEERYLDAYYSVTDFEELTAYQYNFLFTNENAQAIHADLINEIETYFDDSLMSYEAFKDFVYIVADFEDYSQYAPCIRYLPLVTRQYSPVEFADILESFLSEEGYPYFTTGSIEDPYIDIAELDGYLSERYDGKDEIDNSDDGQLYQRFQNYRKDIETLRTSTDEEALTAAVNDVYDFFEKLPANMNVQDIVQGAVKTHRILYGYLATVEDDYNWEFSDTRYSNKLDDMYNVSDIPDTELLEYRDGAIVYSLSAGKMEDSSWLSPCSYEYEYGISWQYVYATYVSWALESGELENPNDTGKVNTDESGHIITYINEDKLYEIAEALMGSNSILWYDNNSIEDILGYLNNNEHSLVREFGQRIDVCITEQMMSDLPKRVNYVDGSVLDQGGSRVITSVTAIPQEVQSLFGTVQYVGTETNVLDGISVDLTPDVFATENTNLIYGKDNESSFDWDFYCQILLGAPKGEELSKRLEKLQQLVKDGEELEFSVPFEHDGYKYTISLASVILNPNRGYNAGYVPVDGEDAQSIWNFFLQKGLTKEATAGIMGNLYQESHFAANNMQNRYEGEYNDETYTAAVDAGTYTNFVHDNVAYGIAQFKWWTLKRDLLAYAKTRGTSVGNLEMQLNFLWATMCDAQYDTLTLIPELNACTTPEEATIKFLQGYERAETNAETNSRIVYANSIYEQFVNSSNIIGGYGGTVPVITSPYSDYATGVFGSSSTCITLSEAQINAVLQSVGNVSSTRKALLRGALQRVGRIPYYLGCGHSYSTEASAMDCSGFVGTMLYQYAEINWYGANCAGIVNGFQKGTLSGGRLCSASELVPGDIIVRSGGGNNHVVIYVGINQYGLPMTIDEMGTGAYDGNVFYQQKGNNYLTGPYSYFIHLSI